MIVRIYLKPGLGSRKLTSLTVPMVQEFLNRRLQEGDFIRKVQVMRTVLSAALTRAVREELVMRNVARLVELPQWQRGTIRPWAADEARDFLAAAKPDPLYTAFFLLILYGLRSGEVLGLRWDDIDFDGGTIQDPPATAAGPRRVVPRAGQDPGWEARPSAARRGRTCAQTPGRTP